MEFPRLWVKSELQLQAYATAMATRDLSHISTHTIVCGNAWSLTDWSRPGIKPTSSEGQHQVPNPLSHNGNYYDIFSNLGKQYIFYTFENICYLNILAADAVLFILIN